MVANQREQAKSDFARQLSAEPSDDISEAEIPEYKADSPPVQSGGVKLWTLPKAAKLDQLKEFCGWEKKGSQHFAVFKTAEYNFLYLTPRHLMTTMALDALVFQNIEDIGETETYNLRGRACSHKDLEFILEAYDRAPEELNIEELDAMEYGLVMKSVKAENIDLDVIANEPRVRKKKKKAGSSKAAFASSSKKTRLPLEKSAPSVKESPAEEIEAHTQIIDDFSFSHLVSALSENAVAVFKSKSTCAVIDIKKASVFEAQKGRQGYKQLDEGRDALLVVPENQLCLAYEGFIQEIRNKSWALTRDN